MEEYVACAKGLISFKLLLRSLPFFTRKQVSKHECKHKYSKEVSK